MGYNRKQIAGKLERKFNDFLESITDSTLRQDVANNSIITGGAIASLLLGEKVNDYDIYFTNKETAYKVAVHYLDLLKKLDKSYVMTHVVNGNDRVKLKISGSNSLVYDTADVDDEEIDQEDSGNSHSTDKISYSPRYMTTNAITLTGNIQLIIRFFGDPEEIHKNFDFVHATCYWISYTNELVLPAAALESILARELIYRGSLYPISSVFRTKKFLKRGWNINSGQYLKMCFQINSLDLTSREVLSDQLVGVDTQYYLNLLESLDSDLDVDNTYILDLITRMFG